MVFERIHPHDRALAQQIIDGVSPSTDFEHEYRLVMPTGVLKHVLVRGRALFDSSGKIEVVGALTDITERKEAEETAPETGNGVPADFGSGASACCSVRA